MNIVNSSNSPASSNEDPNRFRCCCKRMHVKSGAYIIGVVEAMVVVAEIIFFFAHGGGSLVGLVGTILWTLAVVFLFLGLKHERARYLQMNIFMQCLQLLAFVVFIGIGIYWIITGHMAKDDDYLLLGCLALIGSVAGLFIQVWFLIVVFKCYKYLLYKASVPQVPIHVMPITHQHIPAGYLPPEYGLQQGNVPPCASGAPYFQPYVSPPPTYDDVIKSQRQTPPNGQQIRY